MTPLVLFLVAAWVWLCLVMLPGNHMRIALFGPALASLGLIAVFLQWAAERLLQFNWWFAELGHGIKGEQK